MARQKTIVGDVFQIPIGESEKAYGQILTIEKEGLNSIGCAFWEPTEKEFETVMLSSPIAVLLVTPDLYKKGLWKKVSNMSAVVPAEFRPYEVWRSNKWIGAKVVGSGIVVKLMEACCGLYQWDDWADPQYLNKLLFHDASVPSRAKFKSCS